VWRVPINAVKYIVTRIVSHSTYRYVAHVALAWCQTQKLRDDQVGRMGLRWCCSIRRRVDARDIYGAVFEPRNSVVIRRLTLGESVSNSPVPPNRGWGYLGDLMRLFPGTAFVNSPVIWRVPRISNVILGIYLRKWPFLSPVFCNLRKYISGKVCKHFEERLLKVPATRFRKLVSVDCHSWGFS
jgi:hypothetical protein